MESMVIPVVLTINDGFVRQASVVMYSAIKNAKPDTQYCFYVLTHDIKPHNIDFMQGIVEGTSSKLELIVLQDNDLDALFAIGRFGKEACFRLYIPKLLPDLSKVIYIDADTMVVDDLTELYNIDLSNKAYAACSEKRYYSMLRNPLINSHSVHRFEFLARWGLDILDEVTHYINSGIMLINCEYWNQHSYVDRALKFLRSNKDDPNFTCPDQDTINILALQDGVDTIVCLDWKYNVSDNELLKPFDRDNIKQQAHFRCNYYDGESGVSFEPCIIHYVGGSSKRPWEGYNVLMADKYREYANAIGWTIKVSKVRLLRRIVKGTAAVVINIVPYGIVRLMRKLKSKIRRLAKRVLPAFVLRRLKGLM